ncbi:MAG: PSD1 and planctomycete cytochrome C domain-containing protein [Opitutaceae bacterium]|nr:PSD1 and planctomycete cytochrome C domain-containing protein [Opitutaceae bacterium]
MASLTGVGAGIVPGVGYAAEALEFNRDVRPILSDNCFACHGFDAKKRKGKLRLDTLEGATAERDGFQAIVPGDLSKSELWLRINSEDEDERMPPKETHKTLSAAQKEILKRWIIEGARYQPHWAYVAPQRKTPPMIKMITWPHNDIDRLILAKLETAGLKPSPEADRSTLIRRLSLDLTGLPANPTEVAAFLSDQSPDAYERVVDRLLGSPHFGERMAVDWLDAARYADTNGYQIDRDREIWAWRDWVIAAFNNNMPFDRFTIEQIAGDLLPNAALEQRIATGFNRNHMINEEGGIIPEEFLAEYAADRVETTSAVWLGQTFICTRCHDHKFDPFTQRDFYSLKAFFHNVPEQGKSLRQAEFRFSSPPYVKLPSPALDAKLTELRKELTVLKARLAALEREPHGGIEDWVKRLASETIEWRALTPRSASAEEQKPQVEKENNTVLFEFLNNTRQDVTVRAKTSDARITSLRLTCASTEVASTFNWTELSVQIVRPGVRPAPIKLRPAVAGHSLAAESVAFIHDGNRETRVPLRVTPARSVSAVFELDEALQNETGEALELVFIIGSYGASGPTRWRFEATDADRTLFVPAALVAGATKTPEQRSEEETAKLGARYAAQQPRGRELEDKIAAVQRRMIDKERAYSTTMVMEEMEKPRETFILVRGAYDKRGERVTANTPAMLPPMNAAEPKNRLGLARWLVSPENPLTARVTVNRLWQAVFGMGLVKTSEDFGSQGEVPSHPELLDWLATEFMQSGWDVKRTMQLLVTSATYRQQSRFTPELLERDPENRLLARAPRFRLQGEFVRDQALAMSGLLVPTIGGPSVRPYHPPGLYEGVAPTSEDTVKTYVQGRGLDLYRRSLYTYWKRSVPHPAMLAFDVPFREVCTVKRPRTNTPSQALNLMNDPTYVEAARFMAERIMREGRADVSSRLAYGFSLALARKPNPREMVVLRRAYDRAQREFAADPAAANAWLSVGEARRDSKLSPAELAAFATVASTILCMDETITKQ